MSHEMAKQSLYFPEEMLKEIREEAKRLDRPLSWVVAQAWKLARGKIKKISVSDPVEDLTLPGTNSPPESNEGT